MLKIMKLYKYISSKYLDDFINKGIVLFRSLSYFKDYEDKQIRGDNLEGTLKYEPSDGLVINNLTTGKTFKYKGSFESTTKNNDIFVFCMSSKYDQEFYNKFDADICIELIDFDEFIKKVTQSINLFKDTKLIHGIVQYYSFTNPPIIDWALPEKIIMKKQEYFKWQNEYRIAFANNSTLNVENTDLVIRKSDSLNNLKTSNSNHSIRYLKLGNLKNITKIYEFIK